MLEEPSGRQCANLPTCQRICEIGGSNGTRQRAAADAYAAMMNAIEWHVTGKTAYADCAARILTAWGTKLETASAELYQYPCRAMIVAAEMLRYSDGSFYEGWGAGDRTTFLEKVRTVMYPACKQFCTYQNTHPSWYTPCALAVMAAGVLLDDATIYQEGYNLMLNTEHWDTMYGGSIEPSGQMREMGRDNVHGGLTLRHRTGLLWHGTRRYLFGEGGNACCRAWNTGADTIPGTRTRLLNRRTVAALTTQRVIISITSPPITTVSVCNRMPVASKQCTTIIKR